MRRKKKRERNRETERDRKRAGAENLFGAKTREEE